MGAAAGTADAVVLTDWGKPHANFDEVITAMRAGVPANVPCEVVRDRQEAIQRARAMAGKEGVVVVCSKGDEAYALFDQERSQTAWNAAVRALYEAAGAAK
jgi:UDP-N-acetylmuramyl tripeptide synthase